MPNGAQGLRLWENNSDTPLTSSNLSKSIDLISESKFIYYSDSADDYTLWADAVINVNWSALTDEQIFPYVNKYVYNLLDNTVKIGKYDTIEEIYSWQDSVSPYKKVLKVIPHTKISTKYTNVKSSIEYDNFDTGKDYQVFSIESLINGSDLIANTSYYIYLYHHVSWGDNSKFRIVSKFDDINNTNDWKNGVASSISPNGKTVISYRKVGGFSTNASKEIVESSLWDISLRHKHVISESYKVFENDSVRTFRASDIPITDSSDRFVSDNVEDALIESKFILDDLRNDTYSTSARLGIELKWCAFKRLSSINENLAADEIPLIISRGFIDIQGARVRINDDIFLSINTSIPVTLNGTVPSSLPLKLGQESSANNRIYNGLWRVFINTEGSLSFIEDTIGRPFYSDNYKGWYNTLGERCIGKFKVRLLGQDRFVEKMSVTATYDEKAPINTVFIFHGTMCPDGLIPCDGKWHDVNGIDPVIRDTVPLYFNWVSGSWWEESPNILGRTVKMFDSLNISTPKFVRDEAGIIYGGSEDCGASNSIDSDEHTHDYSHVHGTGTIRIISSGQHVHTGINISFIGNATNYIIVETKTTGTQAPSLDHGHNISISSSGLHEHSSSFFDGNTDEPDVGNTSPASSFPPYKEILFCIKK